jgi:N-acetylmuramoyl-L-alanine amidase
MPRLAGRTVPLLVALGACVVVTVPAAVHGAGPAGPLSGRTIVIDPGHNGGNAAHPGIINRLVPAGGFRKACDTTGTATNDGRLSEAAFTLAVARRLRADLAAAGARVVMTRSDNRGVGPCVNRRAAIGNAARADLAISIHADGGPPSGRGFHVIAPAPIAGRSSRIVAPSLRFARRVRSGLRAAGLHTASYISGGALVQRSDLAGLNLSTVPKVFVELGNMRNAADARQLESAAWRRSAAAAIAGAIAADLR